MVRVGGFPDCPSTPSFCGFLQLSRDHSLLGLWVSLRLREADTPKHSEGKLLFNTSFQRYSWSESASLHEMGLKPSMGSSVRCRGLSHPAKQLGHGFSAPSASTALWIRSSATVSQPRDTKKGGWGGCLLSFNNITLHVERLHVPFAVI